MTLANPESELAPTGRFSPEHLLFSTLLLAFSSSCAVLVNTIAWGSGGISILWPTTGLVVAILLWLPRSHWPAYIGAAFVLDLLAEVLPGAPHFRLSISAYLATCNAFEAALGAWLLYPALAFHHRVSRPGQLTRLLAYGVVLAPGIASFLASFALNGHFGRPTLSAFEQWFTGDALGASIVIPLYLRVQRPFSTRRSLPETAALFFLLAGVTAFVFWQTTLPLLYLVLPFLLLVEVRLGLAGSTMGLLAVTLIGGYCTARGRGPLALTHFTSLSLRTIALQGFIFVCMLVLYIVEVQLAERHRFELNLQASEQRFRLLAEGSYDMILLQNLEKKYLYVSPAVTRLLGYTADEFMLLDCDYLVHPEDLEALLETYRHCRVNKTYGTHDFRCLKKDGEYLWVASSLMLYLDPETGEPAGYIDVIRDIHTRKAAEDEMSKALNEAHTLASFDALTGTANRRQFDTYLEQEWARGSRSHSALSILMIDVDHFKNYNDRYGHVAGDICLKQVAASIESCSHRVNDLVARFGGEEFAVVLPNTDADGAHAIAENIRASLATQKMPHEANPHGMVTVSIGCATRVPTAGSLSEALIQAADDALYQAKSAGRNCIRRADRATRVT